MIRKQYRRHSANLCEPSQEYPNSCSLYIPSPNWPYMIHIYIYVYIIYIPLYYTILYPFLVGTWVAYIFVAPNMPPPHLFFWSSQTKTWELLFGRWWKRSHNWCLKRMRWYISLVLQPNWWWVKEYLGESQWLSWKMRIIQMFVVEVADAWGACVLFFFGCDWFCWWHWQGQNILTWFCLHIGVTFAFKEKYLTTFKDGFKWFEMGFSTTTSDGLVGTSSQPKWANKKWQKSRRFSFASFSSQEIQANCRLRQIGTVVQVLQSWLQHFFGTQFLPPTRNYLGKTFWFRNISGILLDGL